MKNYSTMEKMAYAVFEAVKKEYRLIISRRYTTVTCQGSIRNVSHRNNNNILRNDNIYNTITILTTPLQNLPLSLRFCLILLQMHFYMMLATLLRRLTSINSTNRRQSFSCMFISRHFLFDVPHLPTGSLFIFYLRNFKTYKVYILLSVSVLCERPCLSPAFS